MNDLFGEGVALDEDVVLVDCAKDGEVFFESIIDEVLEGGRRVGEVEWHDSMS